MTSPYDIIFGVSAIAFNLLIAGVFIAQRYGKTKLVRRLGPAMISLAVPFTILLVHSLRAINDRWIRVGLTVVVGYLLVELLMDYILMVDFRSKFITHLPYILLEYAAFAGLIYTAFTISEFLGWAVSVTFWLAMAALIYLYAGIRKDKQKKKGKKTK